MSSLYPYNGWLAIDKPYGMTSHTVIAKLRRLLGMKKIGHAGTLDPLATGLLLVAVGEATKLVSYAMGQSKSYDFTVYFGQERDTDDLEGAVTHETDHIPTKEAIASILQDFTGTIEQYPPLYSAIKKNGQKLCDLMRQGKELPEIPLRTVVIERLELISFNTPKVRLQTDCGKGTYIRSLGRDIARKLGSLGHITMLRRTRIGKNDEKRIISLEKIETMVHNNMLAKFLLPLDAVLDDIPVVSLGNEEVEKIRCGVRIEANQNSFDDQQIIQLVHENKLIALGKKQESNIKPIRGFNL